MCPGYNSLGLSRGLRQRQALYIFDFFFDLLLKFSIYVSLHALMASHSLGNLIFVERKKANSRTCHLLTSGNSQRQQVHCTTTTSSATLFIHISLLVFICFLIVALCSSNFSLALIQNVKMQNCTHLAIGTNTLAKLNNLVALYRAHSFTKPDLRYRK